jgi:hypothetical protein
LTADEYKKGDAARPVGEGKYAIKQEIGLDIETEEGQENLFSSDIFTKLKIRKEQVPIKPIIEGKFQ